jgi:hypothetical protein
VVAVAAVNWEATNHPVVVVEVVDMVDQVELL